MLARPPPQILPRISWLLLHVAEPLATVLTEKGTDTLWGSAVTELITVTQRFYRSEEVPTVQARAQLIVTNARGFPSATAPLVPQVLRKMRDDEMLCAMERDTVTARILTVLPTTLAQGYFAQWVESLPALAAAAHAPPPPPVSEEEHAATSEHDAEAGSECRDSGKLEMEPTENASAAPLRRAMHEAAGAPPQRTNGG